jgi:hypothetical protein
VAHAPQSGTALENVGGSAGAPSSVSSLNRKPAHEPAELAFYCPECGEREFGDY